MSAHHRRRLLAAAIVTAAALLAALVPAASPAYAYGSLTVRYALVDTDNCRVVGGTGNLRVNAESTRCVLPDSADGTYFRKDAGGVAIKIELHDGSGMVAKQEFHPYDEILFVYDTRNDGDTVYTELRLNDQWYDSYAPPGTSNVIDYSRVNLSFDEGARISLWDWDNYPLDDSIVLVSGGRA